MKVLQASQRIYSAPTISIGVLIFGISVERVLQNKVQEGMSIEKPNKMPKLKGKAFLKPSRLALDMDIMLFGPGVNAVMNTYDKKPVQLNMLRSYAVKM